MFLFLELVCPECQASYQFAAELLQHFAEHVEQSEKNKLAKTTKKLPDLQPITKFSKTNESPQIEDRNSDVVDPSKFCEVTMEDCCVKTNEFKIKTVERKYRCTYCSRSFGWPTDLKRHILTHTGEKPFACKYCNSKFTRNFVLQKHMLRQHDVADCDCIDENSKNIPPLKPIQSILKQKLNVKEKCKTKRKDESNSFEMTQTSLVCSN